MPSPSIDRRPGGARRVVAALVALAGLLAVSCGDDTPPSATTPPTVTSGAVPWPGELGDEHETWTVEVVRTVDHDPEAFTQGLERSAAGIVESTGLRGASTLRLLDETTGAVVRSRPLDDALFGEGVTVVGDEIIQLTWTSGIALRYDAATFEPVGTHTYEGEGWGLCHDGEGLWMSDGSARLTRRDATTFAAVSELEVRREGTLVADLNELECTDGMILANVWKSDEIVVIDPTTGTVRATIDAGPLVADVDLDDASAVLNGIADLGDGTLLLGGKRWPRHFVVELVAAR